MNLNYLAARELLKQIEHRDEMIVDQRLKEIPNVEYIRELQKDIESLRKEIAELNSDEALYAPV